MEALQRQFATALFVLSGLGAGLTTRMFIETGNSRLKINPRYSADALGCTYSFNEDAVKGAGGTSPTLARFNRDAGDAADFTLTQDAVETSPGTPIIQDLSLGLQTRIQWVQQPFILKPNSTYQFTITNLTAGTLNPSIEILITQDA